MNLLAEYAPSVHNQLVKIDIYMQASILSGQLVGHTPASHLGTFYELSQEMQDTFQGVWDYFLKLQPSTTILEKSTPFAMI